MRVSVVSTASQALALAEGGTRFDLPQAQSANCVSATMAAQPAARTAMPAHR
jgi:hypothetical protein